MPLIFGGTVYRMLEKIMTAKLVLVLGYLSIVAVTMISLPVVEDVVTGFFSFGTVPKRPEILIVGRHFSVAGDTNDAPDVPLPDKRDASRQKEPGRSTAP